MATGDRILINDSGDGRAVKAFRTASIGAPAYVKSVRRGLGDRDVAKDASIEVVLADDGTKVDAGSVQLSLNGQPVNASANKSGGETTVRYSPAGGFGTGTEANASLTFTHDGNTRTIKWSFTINSADTGVEAGQFTGISLQSGGNVVIEWSGSGTLQSTDSITGPWVDVSGASSPRIVSTTETRKFYRLKGLARRGLRRTKRH